MKFVTKRKILSLGGVILGAYLLGILIAARLPGNMLQGSEFGPKLIIWMGEGEGTVRYTNASIIQASTGNLFDAIYAPFFATAKFDETGEPNFVARWVFGVDFNISEPPPVERNRENRIDRHNNSAMDKPDPAAS